MNIQNLHGNDWIHQIYAIAPTTYKFLCNDPY